MRLNFKDKVGKKMHFGTFWSKMELGMHVTYLELRISVQRIMNSATKEQEHPCRAIHIAFPLDSHACLIILVL
ncbi:hypothetical protein DVH24_002233 [Malus domestica]|uniref:Uncharacterized protein n=1 Tax=Malus domestica TaxID=3750 RepID=A0A498I9S0_MALDO|nr:hypothetical protein DVH24_002233 [Malus domestica]